MAIYDLSYIGSSANRLYFNDYSDSNNQGVIYRVKSRAPQRRQLRELDIPVPFESGISDFETLIGEMAYVINGTMYPTSESTADSGLERLRKVSSLDIAQDDAFSDNGYVPYVWTEAAELKQVFVKVLYANIIESTDRGLVQDFTLICKVKDPTIYGTTINTASTGTSEFSVASGSAVHSFEYPIVYGATTATVTTDANNTGDLPVYPIGVTIVGPVNNPRVTNATTGEFIQVNVNLPTNANQIDIAYDKDSLSVERDGVSVIDKVTTDSTFFKLVSGSNEIELSGSSTTTDSYAAVSYRSGWPLS